MQIIDIVPIHYLHLVQNQPMAMFLTHLVENSPEYAKFARNYTGYKILDNSLIELGQAVSIERVLNAAKIIINKYLIFVVKTTHYTTTLSIVLKWL